MKKVELNIIALGSSESQKGNYALILEEKKGSRRLPIMIGTFEAQSIAVALENMLPVRPLTHDLFKSTLDALNFKLKEIIISSFEEGVFHALIIGIKEDGEILEMDSRSSDAIALAVRFGCPIYTLEIIMKEAGVVLENPSKKTSNKKVNLSNYTIEKLNGLLEQALEKEDYESASKIRDVIKKKK